MSRKSESSITTILGMRGCGKSTLTQALSNQDNHKRKVVFDMVAEWNGTHIAKTYDEFANIWREAFTLEAFTIVIRYEFGTSQEEIISLESQIVKLIYLTGKESEVETTIIFEEAQFYFPNHGIDPINMHLLTTGRHAFINIIANTQRPASISKLLISQSLEVYIGQLFEMNDMKYIADCIGEVAFEARSLPKRHFIYYPIGNPDDISIIEL